MSTKPQFIQLTNPVFRVKNSDLERVINVVFPELHYELMAALEATPGFAKFETIFKEELNEPYWNEATELLLSRKSGYYGIHTIMLALLKKNIIKEGHYIILF